MPPPRRKKWTEAEERTLIDKYGEMIGNGSLAKMKTREKKYKPIALHVNSIHHVGDPIAYPWEWSWKDVSNKVQNMRHQYSLVKQKIKNGGDGFDWVEGLTHWSNFLRYKEVFGDVTVSHPFDESNHGLEFANIRQCYHENGVMGLEFDYDDGDANENENGNDNGNGNGIEGYEEVHSTGLEKRKKRKTSEKKAWRFMASQLAQLREMESRFEQREEERERERERRERVMERLKEKRNEEWECRRREREEEVIQWEERSERRRSEWNARIDEMLSEHRAEMAQFQARILDEQQNLTSQLLGIVSQWSGHPTDSTNGGGGGGSSSHYLTQMMQHVGGMVDADAQVEGHNHNHNQDDEFIV